MTTPRVHLLLALTLTAGRLGAQATLAELPRVTVDIRPVATTGRVVRVPAGGNLQRAIDEARAGDEIVLPAGATFTGPFLLPVVAGASAIPGKGPVVTIRSSGSDALPAGRRVTPADSASMARIIVDKNNAEAIGTRPGAAGWRLVGLDITTGPAVTLINRLVRLGAGPGEQKTVASVPANIIIDRSWVHASPTVDLRRCIDLQARASAVVSSYIAGCHSANGDAQAILTYNTPGPLRIENNYLEGSGENVMLGGGDIGAPDLLPSDIEIRRNYFYKPFTWKRDNRAFDGRKWVVKNIFEIKLAHRVLFEGNVLEQSWVAEQAGYALLIKTTTTQHLQTEDITVRSNVVRGAAGGANLAGVDGLMSRVVLDNNLFLDVGTEAWGRDNGRLFQVSNVADLTITHNTGFAPAFLLAMEGPSPRLTFLNNLVGEGEYGVKGSGVAGGRATLTQYVPDFTFTGNVLVGGTNSAYPNGNWVTTPSDVGFQDLTSSTPVLGPRSPFRKRSVDGSDPGINAATLLAATTGVKP